MSHSEYFSYKAAKLIKHLKEENSDQWNGENNKETVKLGKTCMLYSH